MKSAPSSRARYLDECRPDLEPERRQQAERFEDAFDALCSAMVMDECADELRRLPAARDAQDVREGRIWVPGRVREVRM